MEKTISYKELTKDQNLILNNYIHSEFTDLFDLYCGSDYDENYDEYLDIYQEYIIDQNFAEYLKDHTNEIVYYSEALNIYLLGVTHYGTSWSGVYVTIYE